MKNNWMFSIIMLITGSFFLSSCKDLDLPIPVPSCVEDDIRDFERGKADFEDAVSIWQWKVDGNTYYYYTYGCCDQYNNLYDEDCNFVCAPDGGFGGGGDGNCPIFVGDITKTLVWEAEDN